MSDVQTAAAYAPTSRAELVEAMRHWHRLSPAPAEIYCESVEAISFRDLLDLYLATTGAGSAIWRDRSGRIDRVQGRRRALRNLMRDILAAPGVVRAAWARLRELEQKQPVERLTVADRVDVLYLRTDHWFGVTEGGAAAHMRGIINGLREIGHSVRLVTTGHVGGVADDERCLLCEPEYGLCRNIRSLPEFLYNDQLETCLSARWTTWNPTIVYHRLSLMSVIGPILRSKYRVPYICEYNGSMAWMARHWENRSLAFARLALEAERLSLVSADVVIAVSEAARTELLGRGVPPERILVCPNGIDVALFNEPADGLTVRYRQGLGSAFVIGFVGTFGAWHGIDVLAQAFVELRRRREDLRGKVKLLLVGDGIRRPVVESILREGGAWDDCVLTGVVSHATVPSYLSACDILASPHVPNPDGTRFAGSPTKLFEYMAAGKAIVASDLEQIGSVISHGRTGWLVSPADAGALAGGIEILLDNPRLRWRLGAAARSCARAEHGWDKRARAIVAAASRTADA